MSYKQREARLTAVARESAAPYGAAVPEIEIRLRRTDGRAGRAAINTAEKAARIFWPLAEGRDQESLWVAYLDGRHALIGVVEIARGSVNVVMVAPREIFRPAVLLGAVAAIMAHNHPSGDPTPSMEDVELTRRVKAAGDVIGIPVLDHVIVASGGFYSFSNGRTHDSL